MDLESKDIEKILPHRYPFLLVDRVIDFEENSTIIKGIKNITSNEPQFTGHFPGNPIMPGVLMIEALAQLGAIALLSRDEFKGKTPFLAGVENCRFKKPVTPGDQLRLEVELVKIRGPIGKGVGKAYVGDNLCVKLELTFAIG